jgi:Tol biopolymer transport system component
MLGSFGTGWAGGVMMGATRARAMTAVAMTAMLIIGLSQSAGAATSGTSTSRVSVSSAGVQGNRTSEGPAVSDTGRYVAFASLARNLVAGDTNLVEDIFVRDRAAGLTRRVSVGPGGRQANGASIIPSISGNGRYVAFMSDAANLVAGDTNNASDVFVRDLVAGSTRRVSVGPAGHQANGASGFSAISRDGLHVVFHSDASNLVAGDTNGALDIFVRDLSAAATERVSVSSAGIQGDAPSLFPTLSRNGRLVAFISEATNLVTGDDNGFRDVFVRDRQTGVTQRASVGPGGVQADGLSTNLPSISANGRFVGFDSSASNLVVGDTNGLQDIFVRDLKLATTSRVSLGAGGVEANGISISPRLSSDGRFVSFESDATNLVGADTNGVVDVFVRDRSAGTTRRVSVGPGGVQGNGNSLGSAISNDGQHVGFISSATNLVAGDTNGEMDVFVRD